MSNWIDNIIYRVKNRTQKERLMGKSEFLNYLKMEEKMNNEEFKVGDYEYEVLIPLTAKNVLEKNPCEEGFKKFVEKWGKGHTHWNFGDGKVEFKTIGEKGLFITWAKEQIDINGKTYLDWFIKKGFIKMKEKEVRIKVGDIFKIQSFWWILVRIGFWNTINLVSIDGTQTWNVVKKVKDDSKITYEEFKDLLGSEIKNINEIISTQNKAKIYIEEI